MFGIKLPVVSGSNHADKSTVRQHTCGYFSGMDKSILQLNIQKSLE